MVLDVTVTDSNSRPVRGLTEKDFSIAEDGSAQKILSFDVHQLDSPSDFAKLPPMPANTFVNIPPAPEHGPLYVLLLDLVNTEISDEPYARAQMQKFLNSKPAGTRFAIFVLSDGLHLVQGFTDDQKQLASILDPNSPRPHIPRVFLEQKIFGKGDTGMMVSVMTFIGRFLDGLPGRKNLLWFAGDFPLSFAPSKDDVESYQQVVKASLDTLAQAQVALYPIDIRGVAYENAHGAAGDTGGGGNTTDYRSGAPLAASGDPGAVVSTGPNSGPPPNGLQTHNVDVQGNNILLQSYMIQDEVAKTTGGHAFHGNNGLADLLTAVVEDGANYYTLSYSPTNRNYNGRMRSIKVELANKGYQLAYRRSYYGVDIDAVKAKEEHEGDAASAPRKLDDSLYANMRHGAPMAHQIYFRAQIHAVGAATLATPEQMANLHQQAADLREHKKNKAAKALPPVQLQNYVIDYAIMAKPASASTPPMALEIAAAAYDADGKMLNGEVDNSSAGGSPSAAAKPDSAKSGMLRAEQQIAVPVSATSIRIAVRDTSSDRIGAMEVNLPLTADAQAQSATPGRPN